MAEVKQTQEESFKEALKDTYAVLATLGKHCESVDELVGMIGLAIGGDNQPGNDAQLRLLMKLMRTK